MPPITLFFLQASRSIRTAWLLEELGLNYDVFFKDRENNKAPEDFKRACGNPLGKAPTLKDGDRTVYESGAITEYLCDHYDPKHLMVPSLSDADQRSRVQQFIHAAEGTLLLHALAITYLRWFSPPSADISKTEAGMSINVHKDLDWLEGELEGSKSGWLLGEYEHPTAGDVMCHFSVQFIFARGLGVKEEDKGKWGKVRAWVEKCEGCDGYRRAVERTGYTLFPRTM